MNFLLQDVTVIFRRRGGDDLEQSHAKWAATVRFAPDVINMTFTPIVSLLEGVPGIKHLARAIDLYLECKIDLKFYSTADPYCSNMTLTMIFTWLILATRERCQLESRNLKNHVHRSADYHLVIVVPRSPKLY